MRTRVLAAATALACAAGLALAAPAYAEAPSNDALSGAVAVSVPHQIAFLDTNETTLQDFELSCGPWGGGTLWYSITVPTDTPIRISVTSYYTAIGLYTATDVTDLSTLSSVSCQPYGWYGPLFQTLTGGTTYYLQLQSPWGEPITDLKIAEVLPPSNDDFADAQPLAYGETVSADTTDATNEPDEPFCQWGSSGPSVWFAFTAPETRSYAVTSTWTGYYPPILAVYTGSAFPLSSVGCGNPAGFKATAGVTYWVQALGMTSGSTLTVTDAPSPAPSIRLWTDWPMAGSPTRFMPDGTGDPVALYPTTTEWEYGDGTTGPGDQWGYGSHIYTKDGDYLVRLTSTTTDGRSGSGTLQIQVRTHDVSVVSFTAPTNARVGQSKTFVAGLRNTHYVETVDVTLLRGGPSGWVEVTTTTVTLPVKSGNKTTSVNLPYVFSAADQSSGPLSFKVRVALRGPELQTTDNEMVCAPVRVTK